MNFLLNNHWVLSQQTIRIKTHNEDTNLIDDFVADDTDVAAAADDDEDNADEDDWIEI